MLSGPGTSTSLPPEPLLPHPQSMAVASSDAAMNAKRLTFIAYLLVTSFVANFV